MERFKVVNNGILDIDWLLNKYSDKQITPQAIMELKDEVYEWFIDNPFIDFSTKGNEEVFIVDLETSKTCSIIYDESFI